MIHAEKAIALAKKIEERADQIARNVRLEVSLNCNGKSEFMAIMLSVVGQKIMAMQIEAEQRAAGK